VLPDMPRLRAGKQTGRFDHLQFKLIVNLCGSCFF
jgi:hypothetical protein